MKDLFLDNFVSIIAMTVFAVCFALFIEEKYRKSKFNPKEFRSVLRTRFNEALEIAFTYIMTSAVIALVISMISFREIWINDVFHVVFVTGLLILPVKASVKYVFAFGKAIEKVVKEEMGK